MLKLPEVLLWSAPAPFASLLLAEESREARGIAKQAETARASATDNAETLATALEELITSRVDKMSKKVSGAA